MELSSLLQADARAEAIRSLPTELHTLHFHFLGRLIVFSNGHVQLAANLLRIGVASLLAVEPRRAFRFCKSEQFHPLSHAVLGNHLGSLSERSLDYTKS
jgi:hypothetical protein